ncbi:MAG: hypothetical protein ACFB4I_12350 [Cyanophyceae cyanobacterium]
MKIFIASLLVTLLCYLLRGFGMLTFIPGGVILGLIVLSLLTGIVYGVQKTKRF